MSKRYLFDSYSESIPALRRDIDLIPVQNNGKPVIYFHDGLGYMPEHFALDASIRALLSFFTGDYSISQICSLLDNNIPKQSVLEFVQLLDENMALCSTHYDLFAEKVECAFESETIRNPVLAGKSYPENPKELEKFLGNKFQYSEKVSERNPVSALYAPHIDLSIGDKYYAGAFSAIAHLKPKRVIILATSHYSGYYPEHYNNYPFIGTKKNFAIPGKTFQTDKKLMNNLALKGDKNGFTLKDRAHRMEHSIETHLLFLSHIWKHEYTILPILVGGIDDIYYHNSGSLSKKIDQFTDQLSLLMEEGTFVLISGDLSHVGKKFGDQNPAEKLRTEVESLDSEFLEAAVKGDANLLHQCVSKNYDSTRICGFPPLYTFLKLVPTVNGELLHYHWWDETERESAVSFGSILYMQN